MTSSSLARCVIGTALAAFLVAAPIKLAAQAPTALDLSGMTGSGSYLAARHAGQQRDAAAAAAFYRAALKHDPKNGDLLDRTFLSLLVDGDIDESVKYAERIAQADKNDRVAELVLGVHALKHKQFAVARRELALSMRGPITDLTATLLSAWSMYGTGDAKGAVAAIDRLAGPEWYAIFKELHAGMIYDLAGNKKEAGKRFEHAYKLDATALRVVEAYGSWMSRNASAKEALDIFEAFDKVLPRHPLVVEAMNQLKAGEKLPPLVANAQAGAAEALYGLGASLGRRGGEDLGLVYLQLSLYLAPNHPLALLSLADLYESLKKPALAIKAYERVPASSPLHRNAAIQMASNLDALDRPDEAREASRRADQGTSGRSRSDHGARQRSARAQEVRRMRRRLFQGRRHPGAAGKSQLGDLLFPRHLLRALASSGRNRKPISRRRSNCSPSSRTCSIISAIPGSTRA